MSDLGFIVHKGRVSEVKDQELLVTLDVGDACSECHVKGSCGMSENENKVISIPRLGYDLRLNDRVSIRMKPEQGMKAILLAYVVPFCLLLICLLTGLVFFKEWQAAVFSLIIVGIYYLVLSRYNKQIDKVFRVKIEKLEL